MSIIGKPELTRNKTWENITMHKKPSQKQNIDQVLDGVKGLKKGIQFVDAKKHNKMGKDEFLKLLTNQLANQDPLKPMDQNKFAADLAQFAQLEQLANINTSIGKQNSNAGVENKFYAASFLGKQAMTSGTTVDYKGDGITEIPFYLPKHAKNLVLRIFDGKNQLIGQIEKENFSSGSNSIVWNGGSLDGTTAAKDTYRIEVRAWDEGYNEFRGETKSFGVVTGVSFEGGETILTLDGKKRAYLRDVENFKLLEQNSIRRNSMNMPSANKKLAKSSYENMAVR